MFEIVIREITEKTVQKREWKPQTASQNATMDWTPPHDVIERDSVNVYERRLEDLNLRAVIRAIDDLN